MPEPIITSDGPIAVDDAGAAGHVQLMKLAVSADGSAATIPADANGMLVNLGANNDVTVTGTVDVAGPLTDAQLRAAVVPVNQAGVTATGTLGALNAAVALTLNGATGFSVDLRGTFVATVTIQGTINDGLTWFPLHVIPAGSAVNVASVTTATAAGAWVGNANGMQQVRVIATAYTSGTVTVVLRAMLATGLVYNMPAGAATQTVAGTVTANIGTGALAAGANAIGDVGVQYRANATGAASRTHLVSAASANPTIVKAGAGRLIGWNVANTNAAWRYLKLHNQATTPTAGTGVVQTIGVPPNSVASGSFDGGVAFATGIGLTTVTGAADADATAVGAGDLVVDLFWA